MSSIAASWLQGPLFDPELYVEFLFMFFLGVGFLWVLWLFPHIQKHSGWWIVCTKCVHGDLRWTDAPSNVWSNVWSHNVPRISSGSMKTMTRINQMNA